MPAIDLKATMAVDGDILTRVAGVADNITRPALVGRIIVDAAGSGGYTTLAAAITAASAGDVIQLRSNLTVSATVALNKAVILDGAGRTITLANTSNTSVLTVSAAKAKVVDLVVDGNKANQTANTGAGINVSAADVTVERCHVHDVSNSLGVVKLVDGAVRARILDNLIDSIVGAGIMADGNGVTVKQNDLLITGNTVRSPSAAGIFVGNACLRARILGNLVESCTTQAIEIYNGSNGAIVANNQIYSTATGDMGISIGVSDRTLVEGNKIVGTDAYAIEVAGSYNVVQGNIVESPAGKGISVNVSATCNSDYNLINGNNIAGAAAQAIFVTGATGTATGNHITNNRIYNPGATAIHVDIGANNVVRGNTIYFLTASFSGVAGSSCCSVISGNSIGYAAAITTASGYAIYVINAAGFTIADNHIDGQSKLLKGVYVDTGCTAGLVAGNRINGATETAILVSSNVASIVVDGNHMSGTTGMALQANNRQGWNYVDTLGTWANAGPIDHDGTTVGFNAATPVGKRTLGAAATDAATTQTLANNLRQALIDLGLGQT